MDKRKALAFALLGGLAIFMISALTQPAAEQKAHSPAGSAPTAGGQVVGPTSPAPAATDLHEQEDLPAESSTALAARADRFLAAYVKLFACDHGRAVWREIRATSTTAIAVELEDSSPRKGSGKCAPLGAAAGVQLFRRSGRLWHGLAVVPSQPEGRPLYFELAGSAAGRARVSYLEP